VLEQFLGSTPHIWLSVQNVQRLLLVLLGH